MKDIKNIMAKLRAAIKFDLICYLGHHYENHTISDEDGHKSKTMLDTPGAEVYLN